MKRYKFKLKNKNKVEESPAFTSTLEFYLRGNTLGVVYNNQDFLFSDFFKLPEAKNILFNILDGIKKQYRLKYDVLRNKFGGSSKGWLQILLQFINEHLGVYNNRIDVFVRSNGKVDFNLEHGVNGKV